MEKDLVEAQKVGVPILSMWLSTEDEIPHEDKIRLLHEVGRSIPGGLALATILNNASKKEIESRLAEYDLTTQHVKKKRETPQSRNHSEQVYKKGGSIKPFKPRTGEQKIYNTRFQSRQSNQSVASPGKWTNQSPNNWGKGKPRVANKTVTAVKNRYIPDGKWKQITPEEKRKIILKRKNSTITPKKVRRNKVIEQTQKKQEERKEEYNFRSKIEIRRPTEAKDL